MSASNQTRIPRLAATLLAVLGMLAMSVIATPRAHALTASQGGSITLQSTDDLTNRTFQAWEPIRISGVGEDNSLTVNITDDYLPYVRTAALGLPIDKDTTNGRTITQTSSKDDVIEAISHLAQRQQADKNDTEANSFAKKLQSTLSSNHVAPTKTNDDFATLAGGERQLTDLDYGWYLIEETTGDDPASPSTEPGNSPVSLIMTTPVSGDVTITVKSKTPESHKNIVDADHSNQRKAAAVSQNTAIHYQLTFYVPTQWESQYTEKGFWFTMNDTLDQSLVFDKADAIQIGDDFSSTDGDKDFSDADGLYDISLTPATGTENGKTTLKWTFGDPTGADPSHNLKNKSLAGKWVKLYYTAHLSQDAPINEAVGNAYDVTYQHSPYTTEGGEKTPTEHPYVYTYNLAIDKIDGSSSNPLAGVQFEMYSDKECTHIVKFTQNGNTYEYDPNGSVTTLTTGSDGKIGVEGIAATTDGTHYYLKETKAAAGFRATSAVIDATLTLSGFSDQADKTTTDGQVQTPVYKLDAQGGYSSVDNSVLTIKNYRGLLPSTGAQGIILTSILGILLIGGGALMLRRNK